ncbi:MAG: DUF1232 domain-containing protein [Cyanobacteria bacterium P01_A01_bin.135]
MKRFLMQSPAYRWLVLIGSLLYVASPFDLSPDFVPILGQIDDFVVLALVFSQVFRLMISLQSSATKESRLQDEPDEPATTINVTAVPVDE